MDGATPVRILGIGGSTRAGSMSLLALACALKIAEHEGAETRLAAVRDLDLPVYNGERHLSDYPASLPWLLDEVRAADGLIICSPTYHGTISGAVKNVLDSLEFLANDTPAYLGGKPVALLGYGGASAMNTINAVYHAIRALGGLVVPTVAILTREAMDQENITVRDASLHLRIEKMAREVIEFGALIRTRRRG